MAVSHPIWDKKGYLLTLLQAILQLDNIQVKIFDLRNRVGELAFHPTDANPIVELYYLIHPSIILFHPVKCRCKMHRPCVPGTSLLLFDYVNPKQQCCHPNNRRNIFLSLVKWPGRSRPGRTSSIPLLFLVYFHPNPRLIMLMLLHQQSMFGHRVIIYKSEYSCLDLNIRVY